MLGETWGQVVLPVYVWYFPVNSLYFAHHSAPGSQDFLSNLDSCLSGSKTLWSTSAEYKKPQKFRENFLQTSAGDPYIP